MNRALLEEIQRQSGYPCVTLLHTTTPGPQLHPDDAAALTHLRDAADRRLTGDVADDVRQQIVTTIDRLLLEIATEQTTTAVAVCVSPTYTAVVRLANEVRSRCVVDNSFATRDMVADSRRTATFRVITISDRTTRLLVGDRGRLAEERSARWPLHRDDDQTLAQWSRVVSTAVRVEYADYPMPTVLAGVDRSLREILKLDKVATIGTLTGNHDHTSWADLHSLAWPKVQEWLDRDRDRARASLDAARGAHRFAGGIDEVWDLAHEGRVQLLIVEATFEHPARLVDNQLVAAADVETPDVIDDAVDELIEVVLRMGGDTVIVPDGELTAHGRVAAVLRY
jgi:hypothetical protein